MPLPPYPSVPQPRTWSPADQILTGRLRSDLTNAALLLANRPLFTGSQTITGQALSNAGTNLVKMDTEGADAWQMHQIPSSTIAARFPGWYLADGYVEATSIAANQAMATGVRQVLNGTVTDVYGAQGPGNGTNDQGYPVAHLVQLDPSTGDEIALITLPQAACNCAIASIKAEWVGLPSTLSAWPSGTVVGNPQPAMPWSFGTTRITNPGGIPVGATSLTVADPAGMVTGAPLGLDYAAGQAISPLAETVTITSVTGYTVGITATLYPHGGPLSPGTVAVPISSAFLNAQARDMINFLCYPPIASASYNTGSTSLPSQSWPAGTAVPLPNVLVDNFGTAGFGGFSGGVYTFPVSGTYYVYGHLVLASAPSFTTAAGLSINGGTIQWGTTIRNSSGSSVVLAPTVRRHFRVLAGQTVQLFGTQNSGAAVALNNGGFAVSSRMIVVFRSF